MKSTIYILAITLLALVSCKSEKPKSLEEIKNYFTTKSFKFEDVKGIGYEQGITRRDNSDVIEVDGKYYVYYTKVKGQAPGYWGTIWCAVSEDKGYTWAEIGEVLGLGEKGNWDSQATFTPNILEEKGVYYLYYTGVQPTPTNADGKFENNSTNDYTAIGVAKANSPEGPFVRCETNPVISVSTSHDMFDSYRVDDAVLIKNENKFWLYYKGRKYSDGNHGPAHTQMGVAFSDNPQGPFRKYNGNPILDKSHEVFLWKQDAGIACLASISSTFEFTANGIDFNTNALDVKVPMNKRPNAPGAFRADLTGKKATHELSWGISMIHNGPECYLVRWKLVDTTNSDK